MSDFVKNYVTKNIDPKFREGIILEVKKDKKEIYNSLETLKLEITNEVRKIIESASKRGNFGDGIKEISIKINDKKVGSTKGVVHENFKEVLKYVASDIPVFLSGPMGSGKNVICKQVAESLGLKFHFTNAVTQEYKLTGFIDGSGNYHETEFYRAFKDGGVFFLDEMDASIPEVLVILNAAIANRYFEFPNGYLEAHPDFRVIAAGNTNGKGSTTTYTGRFQLDGASLDRFVMIEIPYSERIEEFICNGNKELLDFLYTYRKVSKRMGMNCPFSYRSLSYISKMDGFIDLRKLLYSTLVKGSIEKSSLKRLSSEIKQTLKDNKYSKAFYEI